MLMQRIEELNEKERFYNQKMQDLAELLNKMKKEKQYLEEERQLLDSKISDASQPNHSLISNGINMEDAMTY